MLSLSFYCGVLGLGGLGRAFKGVCKVFIKASKKNSHQDSIKGLCLVLAVLTVGFCSNAEGSINACNYTGAVLSSY